MGTIPIRPLRAAVSALLLDLGSAVMPPPVTAVRLPRSHPPRERHPTTGQHSSTIAPTRRTRRIPHSRNPRTGRIRAPTPSRPPKRHETQSRRSGQGRRSPRQVWTRTPRRRRLLDRSPRALVAKHGCSAQRQPEALRQPVLPPPRPLRDRHSTAKTTVTAPMPTAANVAMTVATVSTALTTSATPQMPPPTLPRQPPPPGRTRPARPVNVMRTTAHPPRRADPTQPVDPTQIQSPTTSHCRAAGTVERMVLGRKVPARVFARCARTAAPQQPRQVPPQRVPPQSAPQAAPEPIAEQMRTPPTNACTGPVGIPRASAKRSPASSAGPR